MSRHGPSRSDPPAVAEYKAAHDRMMRAMDLPYSGDPDVDFRTHMIPHHAGAIDMTIGFGPILSTFSVIVPQSVLLKTTIVFPKGSGQQRKNAGTQSHVGERRCSRHRSDTSGTST